MAPSDEADLIIELNEKEIRYPLSPGCEWTVDQFVVLMLTRCATVRHQKGGPEGLLVG